MEKYKHLRKYLFIILGLIVAVIMLYLLYQDYRPEIDLLLHPNHDTKEKLLYMIRQHDVRDSIFLLVLIAVLNAIPGMSNSVFCILAGICYGPWIGLLINWIGNILGNCAVALLIKKIDFSKKFKKNKFLTYLMNQKYPQLGMTIGFMIPLIPSVLVDYTAVRTNVPIKSYLIMVAGGMFPTSFIYAFGGDALFKGDWHKLIGLIIALLFLLAMFLVVLTLVNKHHQRRVEE